MRAGKDVYLEKPMIHLYSDGPEIIETARTTNRILQVGSQRVSNVIYAKAKELLASGAIGKLNAVSAYWDRNSAIGAWDYTIPLDANTETCDWPRFLGTAPKIPFNAEHFFQWRKWKAYGSGVAGDLFVHLFSGTHFVTGAHGPTRAMATGGLRYWKDGRDVPDVMLALFDYPEGFNLSLRVGTSSMAVRRGEGLTFTQGQEGTIEIAGNSVTVNRVPSARRGRDCRSALLLRRCRSASRLHTPRSIRQRTRMRPRLASNGFRRRNITATAMTISATSLPRSGAANRL